jgi:hypothetical protein
VGVLGAHDCGRHPGGVWRLELLSPQWRESSLSDGGDQDREIRAWARRNHHRIADMSPEGRSGALDLDERAVSQHLEAVRPWPLPRRRRFVVPRRLAACGLGLLALRRLVRIQRPLDLAPFGLRPDLDEHHHDDPGPECEPERIE